eukprot:scaffold674472_cov67-Prasinocladus_malaysianus.AAC.1
MTEHDDPCTHGEVRPRKYAGLREEAARYRRLDSVHVVKTLPATTRSETAQAGEYASRQRDFLACLIRSAELAAAAR